MRSKLYDSGAQAERTSLAWTRTGLAVLVATLLTARLAAERLGVFAVIAASAGSLAAIASLVLARRRYRRAHSALVTNKVLPDGMLPALVAAIACLLGVIEICYALFRT